MYFIYSLLLGLGFLILLPRFLLDAFRHGKYVAGFRERLGSLSPITKGTDKVIWIHCVSVGETQAARPLVRTIKQQFPNHLIAISTITLTGQTLAREVFKHDAAKIFYFPFDWRWAARRTLNAINPDTVLVMETELWPNFLRECKQQNIPVALVNGRLSEQSFRRYRIFKGFMRRVLSCLDLAVMQTAADAERLSALGMDTGKTRVSGNVKFDVGPLPGGDSLTCEFQDRFKLSGESPLVLAASTHAPEEVIIVNGFRQLVSKSEAKPRLMIAPRHPERFAEVGELLKMSGLRWARRSGPPEPSDGQAEVILLDSIGELGSVYSLASIVFVGGSIARSGGHNIIEPAAVGAAVIVGSHTYNFHSIVEAFVNAGAIVQLQLMSDSAAIAELASTISDLLVDPDRVRKIGSLAQSLVNENRGATERTLQLLEPILGSPETVSEVTGPLRANSAPLA